MQKQSKRPSPGGMDEGAVRSDRNALQAQEGKTVPLAAARSDAETVMSRELSHTRQTNAIRYGLHVELKYDPVPKTPGPSVEGPGSIPGQGARTRMWQLKLPNTTTKTQQSQKTL